MKDWTHTFLTLGGLTAAGLPLAYIWRFHDLHPLVAVFRLGAVLTVLSWFLIFRDPWPARIRKAFQHPATWLFLAWFVYLGLLTQLAFAQGIAWTFWSDRFVKTSTMFFFLLGFMGTLRHVRAMILVQVVGASVVGFYFAKAGFPRNWTPISMHDPNDLAHLLAVSAPLALFVATALPSKKGRRTFAAVAVFLAGAAVASQSRGGFLAVAGMILFLTFRAAALSWKARLAIPLALTLGLFLAPAEVRDRLATLGNLEADYNMQRDVGRVATWTRGMGYFQERPVFGWGPDSFLQVDRDFAPIPTNQIGDWLGKAAHNSFVQVLVETGLVGAFLFLGMIGTAVFRLLRLKKWLTRLPSEWRPAREGIMLCNCLLASFVAWMIGAFFLSQAYADMLACLVAISIAADLALRREVLRPAQRSLAQRVYRSTDSRILR